MSDNLDQSRFIIDQRHFQTPSMGDFYVGAVDDAYLKLIDQYLRDHVEGESAKSAFYTDAPPVTTPGYYPEKGVYFLRARIRPNSDVIDGDTIAVSLADIDDGGDKRVTEHIKQGISHSIQSLNTILNGSEDGARGDDFRVRLLAIDAPEIPHWGREYSADLERYKTCTTTVGFAKTSDHYVYVKGSGRSDDTRINCIDFGDGVWHEYQAVGRQSLGLQDISWLIADESDPRTYEQGMRARQMAIDAISKADGEIYIMLDGTILNRNSQQFPRQFGSKMYNSNLLNQLKQLADGIADPLQYRSAGYNLLGQDAYRRFLGAVYLKISGQWINLAKRLIVDIDQIQINKNYRDMPVYNDKNGMASDVFGVDTHDYRATVWADALWSAGTIFDDRRSIQKEIFRISFDTLKEWSVVIGDTAFFVPPTAIRCLTQTTAERVPIVRAKGSMARSSEKSERVLELTLYFNDEKGINGHRYETQTPNKEKVTFYLNGLRSLVAQFKLTPFLPIDNAYVNEVLNIEAVSLLQLRVGTLQGFPRLLQATLVMQEFNYRVYMPELPAQTVGDGQYRNYFASCINFATMRYYYQRPILAGQTLAARQLAFNSDAYMEATLGNRTALLPMRFESSSVKFYVANEAYLKQMLQTRIEAMRRPDALIVLSQAERQAAADLAVLHEWVLQLPQDAAFSAALSALNDEKIGVFAWRRPYQEVSSAPVENIRLVSIEENAQSQVSVTSGAALREKLDQVLAAMERYFKKAEQGAKTKRIDSIAFFYRELDATAAKGARVQIGVRIKTRLEYLTTDEAYQDLKRDASLFIKAPVNTFFNERAIEVPLAIQFATDACVPMLGQDSLYASVGRGFRFDAAAADLMFLGYCRDLANETADPNSDAITRRQAVDIEQMDSIRYDLYDVGDVRAESFSVALKNTLSRIGVSGLDGYAPQYMGGQDAEIRIDLITTSQKTAAMLNALPRLSSYYAREYRLVMPCWPLKIESELSAFFGINETLVESVTVSTIENVPGTYRVSMQLRSVDRTMRNREALKRIEANNAGYQGIQARTQANVRSYFEIQDVLAEAELYPDLELPTISELQARGYQFVRYKFQDHRVYPDPDFYFIYPHLLSSQILRETIVKAVDNNLFETRWEDQTGAQMKTRTKVGVGIAAFEMNEAACKQNAAIKAVNDIQNRMAAERAKCDNAVRCDPSELLLRADAYESWSICPDIKCVFLESRYQAELKAYETDQSAQEAAVGQGPEQSQSHTPEGKWVYDNLTAAKEAAAAIQTYLEETEIDEEIPAVSFRSNTGNSLTTYDALSDVRQTVMKYLADEKIDAILQKLNVENTGEFREITAEIVYAAACAATGQKEYAGKIFDASWKPAPDFIGIRLADGQDVGGKDLTSDVEDAVRHAIEFGPFRTRQYSKAELARITGEAALDPRADLEESINTTRYLLDPYYRYASVETIERYKRGTINNTKYATAAFMRLMLYWLKYLIDTSIIPSVSTDILRRAVKHEIDIQETQSKYTQEENDALARYLDFFLKNSHALDAGKCFLAAVLAATSGNRQIQERIANRDYRGLNGYVQGCSLPFYCLDPADGASLALRKMVLALVGTGRIKNSNAIGVSQTMPATEYAQQLNEKKYIEAAEDPSKYIMHSFYDMVVNDARGRMLRAFPTFYLLFLDEGREIGMWKLHDNFYNTSSISEIQIVKSRKIAADTARIVMSNMYRTYTTEDENARTLYMSGFDDVFDSIFSPKDYAAKEEEKRTKTPPVTRARIRPGARMHIRMGYGSNAAALPVLFNGVIAEVQAGEALELAAQGDGIELTNPIFENDEAHELQFKDNIGGLLTNGATPMTILNALLTTKGGWLRNLLKDTRFAHLLGRSPYGIYHFGDTDFKEIFKSGEPTQNIYEAMARPVWGEEGSVTSQYATDDVPRITFDIFGKSAWDILHLCQSVTPDFIASVAPFGFRSTIFHGAPRYYYAYDYSRVSGALLEKRKPFQQFHLYTSYGDILKNSITVSDKEVKTCAIGLYEIAESGNFKSQHRCGPLWVDIEIYPEEQKTMMVDTQLYGKGVPIVGYLTNSLTNRLADWFADDKGALTSHEKIAWRMTANALKNSVKDMYQGELIVLGDPTVKPYDRIFINDAYENMIGQCLVKETVQNFSALSGYTTSIYPDCIATVDDRHELAVQSAFNAIASCSSAMAGTAIWAGSLAFGGPAATLAKSLQAIGAKAAGSILKGAGYAESIGAAGAMAKTQSAMSALKDLLHGLRGSASGLTGRAGLTVGVAATGIPALAALATIGTTMMIGKYVTESIARWSKNFQVLQVFPLKRHGLVMTAGLGGHKGLVYGAPTYSDPGLIKSLYSKLTTSDNPYIQFVQEMLFSEEMINIGYKYKRDGGLVDDSGNPTADERQFDRVLRAVAGGQGEGTGSYRESMLLPRAALNSSAEVKAAYDHFALLDPKRLQTDPKLQNNRLISADQRLTPYVKEKFFLILHEQENLSVGPKVKALTLMLNQCQINTKAILASTKRGTPIYDLPLLNGEAMHILYEIVRRAKSKMPAGRATDPYQSYAEAKGSFIALKSALRIGDCDTLSATGFAFVLQGVGKAVLPLAAAIRELREEIAAAAKEYSLIETTLFDCSVLTGNELAIAVRMPSIYVPKQR